MFSAPPRRSPVFSKANLCCGCFWGRSNKSIDNGDYSLSLCSQITVISSIWFNWEGRRRDPLKVIVNSTKVLVWQEAGEEESSKSKYKQDSWEGIGAQVRGPSSSEMDHSASQLVVFCKFAMHFLAALRKSISQIPACTRSNSMKNSLGFWSWWIMAAMHDAKKNLWHWGRGRRCECKPHACTIIRIQYLYCT